LRDPLYRNGYALVASSAITSVLGLVFWLVAARRFTAEVIGISSATISAMLLLANLGQLNLVNALNRFVPRAGPATRRVVAGSYAAAVVLGGAAAVVFLVGLEVWSPELVSLVDQPRLGLWFVVATMGWTVFVLQDGALTGLRKATFVTIENFVYAVAKLGLLFIPLLIVDDFAVFLAWTIPLLPVLAVVNGVMFARLIPAHAGVADHDAPTTTMRVIARFAGIDYVSSMIWTATVNVLPLIVLGVAGAEANAGFFLAWSVAYSLQLVSRYMGMSLITEASMERSQLFGLAYRTTVQTYLLVIPAAIVIAAAAPLILRVFGASYTDAAGLLRLLALAAIPVTLNVIYMSILRVQRRMGALLVMSSATAVLVVPASLVLLRSMGVAGVGIAWLGAQIAIAVVVAVTQFRPVWAAGVATPRGRRFSEVLLALRRRPHNETVEADLRAILGLSADDPLGILATVGEVVVAIDHAGGRVIRLARSERGDRAITANWEALHWWQQHVAADQFEVDAPMPAESATRAGRSYSVESLLPGVDLHSVDAPLPAIADIVRPLMRLHATTSTEQVVDDGLIAELVTVPLRHLAANIGPARSGLIEGLRSELTELLAGRRLMVGRSHGDYTPRNILVDPDSHEVTGIVDWERSNASSLPDIDAVALLMSRRAGAVRELGDIVVEIIAGTEWTDDEAALLEMCPNRDALGVRGLVLLTWLHHIDSNLSKAGRFARNWVWTARNIDHVIDHV
jgi:O-antigen/teichoic acid export membrane protein